MEITMEPTELTCSISQSSSAAIARRRRQARLRQSLHDVDSDMVMSSLDRWGSDADSNHHTGHSGFEMISKRREANARERLRVRNLNSGFAKLRRILPTVSPNRKPSKVDTLQGAIDYIDQLEKVLDATGGIPNIKNTMRSSSHAHSRQSVTERPFLDSDEGQLPASLAVRYATPFLRGSTDVGGDPYCCLYCHDKGPTQPRHSTREENYGNPGHLHPTPPAPSIYPYSDERTGETIPHEGNSYGIPSPASSLTSDDSCERNQQLMHYEASNYRKQIYPTFSHTAISPGYDSKGRTTPPEILITSSDDASTHTNCSPSTSWHYEFDSNRQSLSEEEAQWDAEKSLCDRSCLLRPHNANPAKLPPVSYVYRNNMSLDA